VQARNKPDQFLGVAIDLSGISTELLAGR